MSRAKDREKERLVQEIQGEEYRDLLRSLQARSEILRRFDSWPV